MPLVICRTSGMRAESCIGTCETLWDAFPTPHCPHGCLGTRCFPKAIKRGHIYRSKASRTYLMPSYPVHSSVSRHASTRAKPARKWSLILSLEPHTSVDTASTLCSSLSPSAPSYGDSEYNPPSLRPGSTCKFGNTHVLHTTPTSALGHNIHLRSS
jgi:hypothetical protein